MENFLQAFLNQDHGILPDAPSTGLDRRGDQTFALTVVPACSYTKMTAVLAYAPLVFGMLKTTPFHRLDMQLAKLAQQHMVDAHALLRLAAWVHIADQRIKLAFLANGKPWLGGNEHARGLMGFVESQPIDFLNFTNGSIGDVTRKELEVWKSTLCDSDGLTQKIQKKFYPVLWNVIAVIGDSPMYGLFADILVLTDENGALVSLVYSTVDDRSNGCAMVGIRGSVRHLDRHMVDHSLGKIMFSARALFGKMHGCKKITITKPVGGMRQRTDSAWSGLFRGESDPLQSTNLLRETLSNIQIYTPRGYRDVFNNLPNSAGQQIHRDTLQLEKWSGAAGRRCGSRCTKTHRPCRRRVRPALSGESPRRCFQHVDQ